MRMSADKHVIGQIYPAWKPRSFRAEREAQKKNGIATSQSELGRIFMVEAGRATIDRCELGTNLAESSTTYDLIKVHRTKKNGLQQINF